MGCAVRYTSAALVFSTCAVGLFAQPADRGIATFEDSPPASVSFIVETPDPFMYQGLVWRGFSVVQSDHESLARFPLSGFSAGAVSGTFAAVAAGRAVSESTIEPKGGGSFFFFGAHLTAAWRTGLKVTVEGLLGENVVFSRELVANTTEAVQLSGAWEIETLRIQATGGSDGDVCPPSDCYPGPELIIDDLTYSLKETSPSAGLTIASDEAEPVPATPVEPIPREPVVEQENQLTPATPSSEPVHPADTTNGEPNSPALGAHRPGVCESDPHYGVQVGAFSTFEIARRLQTALKRTYGFVQIYERQHEKTNLYHLVVGCTEDRSEAVTLIGTFLAEGTRGFVVIVTSEVFGEPL